MKSQLKFALLLAIGMGVLEGGTAAAQERINAATGQQVTFATFNPNQAAYLQQVDRRRRCDGDGDRDDRGCYYVYTTPSRGYAYYGNGYYATPVPAPYYPPSRGWYDRGGHWHAYDKDRDRDRRRHDDDRR